MAKKTKPDTANERKARQREKMKKWLVANYGVATAEALVMLMIKNNVHIHIVKRIENT